MGRKFLHNCSKSIIPKEKLENLIVDITLQAFCKKEILDEIADSVMQVRQKQMRDKSLLNILIKERDQIKKSLSNIMKAIEQGILNSTTKSRMEELEEQLAETENKILIEQFKVETQLKREQIIEFITHILRHNPKILIHTFIQKITLWDDKIEKIGRASCRKRVSPEV